jgi:hypothetical protein
MKQRTTWHQGKLASEWAAIDARLPDVLQRELALEASPAIKKEVGEQ